MTVAIIVLPENTLVEQLPVPLSTFALPLMTVIVEGEEQSVSAAAVSRFHRRRSGKREINVVTADAAMLLARNCREQLQRWPASTSRKLAGRKFGGVSGRQMRGRRVIEEPTGAGATVAWKAALPSCVGCYRSVTQENGGLAKSARITLRIGEKLQRELRVRQAV